jgi:uncharacterized protein YrrD
MEYRQGATIETSDSESMGSLERVVIGPRTKSISHLVIRKGALIPEEKVIPVDLVAESDEDRIRLRPFEADFDSLPNFEDTHFVLTGEDDAVLGDRAQETGRNTYRAPLLYYYPPVVGGAGLTAPGTAAAPYLIPDTGTTNYAAEVERNIPEGTVAIREGSAVYSSDDKEVGTIERFFTDPQGEHISHIVISKGLLFKAHKLIPAHWIDKVEENGVHLAVNARYLETLKDFEE